MDQNDGRITVVRAILTMRVKETAEALQDQTERMPKAVKPKSKWRRLLFWREEPLSVNKFLFDCKFAEQEKAKKMLALLDITFLEVLVEALIEALRDLTEEY